jgi:hypothetical protein
MTYDPYFDASLIYGTTKNMNTETKPTAGFRAFCKIKRQGHRETFGIEEGRVYVFPKIDGTNASVWSDGVTVFAGSRTRQLSVGNDNAGFNTWVQSDDPTAQALREMALKFPELVFYGEWLVPHTLKTYTEDAWRKFYIFDVFERSTEFRGYIKFESYKVMLDAAQQDYIDPIAVYTNPTGAQLKAETENNDFLIIEGMGVGEGVVIKNYEWRMEGTHDKVWGKFVRSEFKAGHRREMGAPEKGGKTEVERLIAEQFVTPTLVDKNIAKVMLDVANSTKGDETIDTGTWTSEYMADNYRGRIIPQLLGRVWNDILEEELAAIVKKHKFPTINFKRLQTLVTLQVKALATELF